jgi:microsomal dipeptidase-like Zn-dependent dipeptidase
VRSRSHRIRATLPTALVALLAATAVPAHAADRYALAGGCYALQAPDGRFLVKQGDRYLATATDVASAEPIRMQATALGSYLLYDKAGDFVTADGAGAVAADTPSGDADWRLTDAGGDRFTLVLPESGQKLTIRGAGTVGTVTGAAGSAFAFQKAARCAQHPESEVNVSGTPYRAPTPYAEAKGLIETHLHGMAFEFLGGSVHCGRPWHPFGIASALVDCPDHGPDGRTALAENLLAYGNPLAGHNTDGWPTFAGWPTHRTYVHEQTYWKNLERAWRGGLRLFTNLLVDNAALCEVYPIKRNSCNEMTTVRLQAKRMYELQDYIDAQEGGPGKGWYRIVKNPFEAREVINAGKLAVIMGIETSEIFDCGEYNHVPQCDRATIDRQLEEMHRMGVRQVELSNKFDNALVGVTGDSGETGIITNSGNRQQTGHYWAMETCLGPDAQHEHDKEQITNVPNGGRDDLVGGILKLFLPPDALPAYPPPPHCNQVGLTTLGAYLMRRIMEKHIIFDPDHMSVLGRDQALTITESKDYGGVMSSHSWSTPDAYRRILRVGGLVTPAPKTSEGFISDWKELRAWRNPRYFFGTGFSTDMNGFASQAGPRAGADRNGVVYPFKSLDGSTTLDRHKVGSRTYDLNKDGTAHFGLYPDRIEDIRRLGGPEPAADLLRGAEAYLQMWERAEGVPGPKCRAAQRRFISTGLGEARIGMDPERLLRSAGQPEDRPGRVWTYCANGSRGGKVKVVFDESGRVALVASTAPRHRAAAIGRGSRVRSLPRSARRFGPGVRARPAGRRGNRFFYGVRKGRVRFAGVASRAAARTPAALRAYLRRARL